MMQPARLEAAFIVPSLTESTRLIWPAPMPMVRSGRANTIAFDLTCLHTFHPKANASYSSSVGGRLETTLRARMSEIEPRSRSWRINPPTIFFMSSRSRTPPPSGCRGPTSRSRKSFFLFNSTKAAASKPGATTTSRKVPVSSFAVVRSTIVLNATTPPKAEIGSVSRTRI